MATVRRLTDDQFLQLLKLAAGLLPRTGGDLPEALRLAMPLHRELLRTIHQEEIRSDLGPVDAVLFVPSGGGLAIRVERRPAGFEEEEVDTVRDWDVSAMDLSDLEITEFGIATGPSLHRTDPHLDGGVLEEWD